MTRPHALIAEAVRAYGRRFDPEVIGAMRRLIGPMHDRAQLARAELRPDLAYGDHPRQRLDVYAAPDAARPRPALLFVHGGGFTAGDKRSPDGAPFYANVGAWAARNGMVGVTMTYRLAPEHVWPAGADDVRAAVEYLHGHANELGIDASRIVVMGQSAGAAHVAGYLAQLGRDARAAASPCAAVLVSGLYDIEQAQDNPPKSAYFGSDPSRHAAQSPLPAMLECGVPYLVAINEYDLPDFAHQAALLESRHIERHGLGPWFCRLADHNHLSSILAFGLDDDALGVETKRFLDRVLIDHVAGATSLRSPA